MRGGEVVRDDLLDTSMAKGSFTMAFQFKKKKSLAPVTIRGYSSVSLLTHPGFLTNNKLPA